MDVSQLRNKKISVIGAARSGIAVAKFLQLKGVEVTGKGSNRLTKKIRDKIVQEYKPEKIILFGSRAYGKPHPDSDYDIFIIKRTRKHPLDRIREVSQLFSMRDFGLDIIVRTPAEVKRRLSWGDFFYKEVLTKGRVLYEK